MDAATHAKWLEDTRRFWDAGSDFEARYRRICYTPDFAATEDETSLRRLWDEDTTERALPLILRGVPIQPDWTCLEIGCGIGRLLTMAQRCRRVIGIDLSEKMAAWSREYLADVPNAEVLLNDGCSLPGVEDASIDFVFSHLAFQHITLYEVIDAYLDEIARVLKPGGYCRIQNWRDAPKPIRESIKDMIRPFLGRGLYRSARCWVWADGKQVKFGGIPFHPRDWRKRLRAHGLRPISTELGVGHEVWMWTTCVRTR